VITPLGLSWQTMCAAAAVSAGLMCTIATQSADAQMQSSGITSQIGGQPPAASGVPDPSTVAAAKIGATLGSTSVGTSLSNPWPASAPNGNYTPHGWQPSSQHPGYKYGADAQGIQWSQDPVTGLVQKYGPLENRGGKRQRD
jgi:hypothetical protein